jgi:hypothetical protein
MEKTIMNKEAEARAERLDAMIDMAIKLGLNCIGESCGSGDGIILVTSPVIMERFVNKIRALNVFNGEIVSEDDSIHNFHDHCNENFAITTSTDVFDSFPSSAEFRLSFWHYHSE